MVFAIPISENKKIKKKSNNARASKPLRIIKILNKNPKILPGQ